LAGFACGRLRALAPWLAAQTIYNECRLAPVRQAAFLLLTVLLAGG
jgi:hypothetical protein